MMCAGRKESSFKRTESMVLSLVGGCADPECGKGMSRHAKSERNLISKPVMIEIVIRTLHFVSVLTLVAAVVVQHWGLRRVMTRTEIGRLQRMDIVYAISVVGVLATGFLQWLAVGKPADFYTANGVFHIKLALFLVVGLISIYPSIFFSRNRKGDPDTQVTMPRLIVWSVRTELILLFAMPLLATLMARGIGLSSD